MKRHPTIPGSRLVEIVLTLIVLIVLLAPAGLSAQERDAGGDVSATQPTALDAGSAEPQADAGPEAKADTGAQVDAGGATPAKPDAGSTAQPDQPPPDVLPDIPEPYKTQIATLRSDDVELNAALFDWSARLDSRDGLDALRVSLESAQVRVDEELTTQNDALDALHQARDAINADSKGPVTEGYAMLLRLRREGVQRSLDAHQARADDASLRLVVIHEQLAFVDRRVTALQGRAVAVESAEAKRAQRNREEAQKQKLLAAEDREQTERRILQAEAEREAAANLEKAYQKLAELEPTILEEKLYIEARRQYEFSAQLEEQGDRESSFNSFKASVAAKIRDVRGRLDRNEKPDQARKVAKSLFDQLSTRRRDARATITDLEVPINSTEEGLKRLRADLATAEEQVASLTEAYREDKDNVLRKKELSVAQAELERLIAYDLLLQLRQKIVSSRLDLAFAELKYAKDTQELLFELMPESEVSALRALNTSNVGKIPLELADFWLATRHYVRVRVDQMGQFSEKAFSLDGFVWLFKLGFAVAVLIVLFRFIRSRRESWVKKLTEAVMRQPLLRRRRHLVIKAVEVFYAILQPLSLLLLLQLVFSLFPEDAPLVVIARVLINSYLFYLIFINVIRTLILPSWYRVAEAAAEASPNENDKPADFVQNEADLLDVNVRTALFIVSSLRWMLLYTLVCQYSLYLIRSALGDFFVAHWVTIFGYLGYIVVGYILLSQWRNTISERFAALLGTRSQKAVDFVLKSKERFYGVGVIFGALLYVLGKEGFDRARRYISNLEIAHQVQNFFFRKSIEMGAESKKKVSIEVEKLPPGYCALFEDRPLKEDTFFVDRPAAEQAILAIHETWKASGRCASIVLEGEHGMGKTTLLAKLRRGWIAEGHPVSDGEIPPRLNTRREALLFIAALLDLDVDDVAPHTLVEKVLALPSQTIIVDECHNLILRRIGGFAALDAFRTVVRMTDHHHCWIMVFNRFAWKFIQQVTNASQHFGHTITLPPMSDADVRTLVEKRTKTTEYTLDFTNLVLQHDNEAPTRDWAEFSRSAQGYYRLLADFAKGNPRVAMHYWLRSLTVGVEEPPAVVDGEVAVEATATETAAEVPVDEVPMQRLEVHLFDSRSNKIVSGLPDLLKFALSSIIQHDSLTIEELCEAINITYADAVSALNYFEENGFITIVEGRARVNASVYRQTLNHLTDNNFLQK